MFIVKNKLRLVAPRGGFVVLACPTRIKPPLSPLSSPPFVVGRRHSVTHLKVCSRRAIPKKIQPYLHTYVSVVKAPCPWHYGTAVAGGETLSRRAGSCIVQQYIRVGRSYTSYSSTSTAAALLCLQQCVGLLLYRWYIGYVRGHTFRLLGIPGKGCTEFDGWRPGS